MTAVELLRIVRTLSAQDRKTLAAIATRMKQRHTSARRRKLTIAMRAMDAGEKFTWSEVRVARIEANRGN